MFRLHPLLRSLNLLKSVVRPRALALSMPFLLCGYLYQQNQCFFWGQKYSRNKLQDRAIIAQYPANNPIQDRFTTYQLKSIPGYVAAVFDGHGGWQMSDFAMKNLTQAIDKAIEENRGKYKEGDQLIIESIKDGFKEVENGFLRIAREGYALGFPQLGRVGSCALVMVVANNKVYAANAGDSQGLIFELKDKDLIFSKLNKKLNANSKKQQARLKTLFPTQADIVTCKNNNPKSCYVKGRLQPTRALGDFRLKMPQFNNPDALGRQYGFQGKLQPFTGPYILSQPQIRVFDLTKNHKCAVLACDGLWDQLTKQQVTDIVHRKLQQNKPSSISQALLDAALDKAATNATLSISELKKIPQGEKRRKLHDDITIITINLESQVN